MCFNVQSRTYYHYSTGALYCNTLSAAQWLEIKGNWPDDIPCCQVNVCFDYHAIKHFLEPPAAAGVKHLTPSCQPKTHVEFLSKTASQACTPLPPLSSFPVTSEIDGFQLTSLANVFGTKISLKVWISPRLSRRKGRSFDLLFPPWLQLRLTYIHRYQYRTFLLHLFPFRFSWGF